MRPRDRPAGERTVAAHGNGDPVSPLSARGDAGVAAPTGRALEDARSSRNGNTNREGNGPRRSDRHGHCDGLTNRDTDGDSDEHPFAGAATGAYGDTHEHRGASDP